MLTKQDLKMWRKNGYDKLTAEEKEKFEKYYYTEPGEKISNAITFEDFYEIMSKVTVLAEFSYRDIIYGIYYYKRKYHYYCEGDDEDVKSFSKDYKTIKELFDDVKIDGVHISQLWDEIILEV